MDSINSIWTNTDSTELNLSISIRIVLLTSILKTVTHYEIITNRR